MPLQITASWPLSADEHMALMRLVMLYGPAPVAAKIAEASADVSPRDAVRQIIADEHGPAAPLDITKVSDTEPRVIPAADAPDADLDPAKVFGGKPLLDFEALAAAAPVPSVPIPPAPAPVPAVPIPPTAATAPTAAPAPTNALDAAGLPWDGRIHSSTKVRNADQTWRQKRGVTPELLERVTGELKALIAIPAGAPPPPDAFAALMKDCVAWTTGGKLTQTDLIDAVKPLGLASIVGLQARPDLVSGVHDALRMLVASR